MLEVTLKNNNSIISGSARHLFSNILMEIEQENWIFLVICFLFFYSIFFLEIFTDHNICICCYMLSCVCRYRYSAAPRPVDGFVQIFLLLFSLKVFACVLYK